MSDTYDRVSKRIAEVRTAGVEPDKVVIPADDWNGVKQRAEVEKGNGVMGGDKTLVNGVKAVWTQTISHPELVIKVDND